MNHNDRINRLYTLWSIQDTLLQTYRTIFLTGESIIISISAVFLSVNANKSGVNGLNFSISISDGIFMALFFIGVVILYLWFTICHARGYDVSYVQSMIMKFEKGSEKGNNDILDGGVLSDFKVWQRKKNYCKKCYLAEVDFLRSRTRKKMEVILPLAFFFVWVVLLFTSFFLV